MQFNRDCKKSDPKVCEMKQPAQCHRRRPTLPRNEVMSNAAVVHRVPCLQSMKEGKGGETREERKLD